jgi:hypothetical protein
VFSQSLQRILSLNRSPCTEIGQNSTDTIRQEFSHVLVSDIEKGNRKNETRVSSTAERCGRCAVKIRTKSAVLLTEIGRLPSCFPATWPVSLTSAGQSKLAQKMPPVNGRLNGDSGEIIDRAQERW